MTKAENGALAGVAWLGWEKFGRIEARGWACREDFRAGRSYSSDPPGGTLGVIHNPGLGTPVGRAGRSES